MLPMRRARRLLLPLALVLLVVVVTESYALSVQARPSIRCAPTRICRMPPPTTPWPVYILGDSITFGRSATTFAHSYRDQLAATLQARSYRNAVRIEYAPDDTTQFGPTWHSGWKLADALTAAAVAPPSSNTRVVVVEIGTNDSSGLTDPATFAAGYADLVAALQAAAPSATIVCLTAWDVASRAAPYDAAIADACPGGRVVDLTSLYGQPTYHGPAGVDESWLGGYVTDSYHPNDAAHAAIAAGIASLV